MPSFVYPANGSCVSRKCWAPVFPQKRVYPHIFALRCPDFGLFSKEISIDFSKTSLSVSAFTVYSVTSVTWYSTGTLAIQSGNHSDLPSSIFISDTSFLSILSPYCTIAHEKRPDRQCSAELVFHFEILLAIEDAA